MQSLQSALFSKFNKNKVSFSCEIINDLETTFYCKLPRKKKHKQTRDCHIDIKYMQTNEKSILCSNT